jgi:hypothetical protein
MITQTQTDLQANHIAKWEDEAARLAKIDKPQSWFVPPIVLPIFFVVVIAARIAYVIYS